MPIGVSSTLPVETEHLIQKIIGCAIGVHRQLGPGYLERIYTDALAYEFEVHKLVSERETSVLVRYKDRTLSGKRVDLIVNDRVIVEVKAVSRIEPLFQAKLISYLRTTGIRAGLMINFNERLLKDGIKRFVL